MDAELGTTQLPSLAEVVPRNWEIQMKKYLVFGDDTEKMAEVAKLIRASRSKAHYRSLRHWQGEAEACDGIALLAADEAGEETAKRIVEVYGKDKVVGPEHFRTEDDKAAADKAAADKAAADKAAADKAAADKAAADKAAADKAAADKAAADKAAADKAAADKAAADKAAAGGAKS